MVKSFLMWLLGALAKSVIKKYRPIVIGITGSVGKTSAKEAIMAVLKAQFRVRATTKNYNNEIGVPMTIIGATTYPGRSFLVWTSILAKGFVLLLWKDKQYPEMLILEMGADKPGDIKYLTEMAPCTVGVLTYISHAHTEFFKSLKAIAAEKRIIIKHLPKDGYAIVNFDCAEVMETIGVTSAQVISYGFNQGAVVQATDVKIISDEATGWPTGLNFKVLYAGSIVPVFLPGMMARESISAALAGLCVGVALGVNLVEGAEGLASVQPIPGHLCLIPGVKDTLIIDDTYNSSPAAAKAALKVLQEVKLAGGSYRYAVLGDMLELGPETENAHREVGFVVAEHGIDYLITVGEAAKGIATAAHEAGLGEDKIARFATSVEAGKFLQEKLHRGDVVLVKGSQGMRMEKIVKEVMDEPLRAGELLVRQSDDWLRK
jgi:UDP-N-acetylmuramoyl-tripeptide--D-alanyl-D-alanine ligase